MPRLSAIRTSGISGTYSGARAFLDLGSDGMIIKRYILRDPYAQTTLIDVVTASLWKIVLVHLVLGLTLLGLKASKKGRRILLPVAACAARLLSFALASKPATRRSRSAPPDPG